MTIALHIKEIHEVCSGSVCFIYDICLSVIYIGLMVLYLKQYSEISGRLKHPFYLTLIDRYSLGKLMFKISVGYEFTLARYAE